MRGSIYIQDIGAEVVQILRLLRKIKFIVEIELVRGYPKVSGSFENCPLHHLIRWYDKKAGQVQNALHNRRNDTNIKFHSYYIMKVKDKVITNSMKEAIQIIDIKESEEEYARKKYTNKIDFIDLEARNSFPIKKVIPSIIKCFHRYNYYGVRKSVINSKMVGSECPRYSKVET